MRKSTVISFSYKDEVYKHLAMNSPATVIIHEKVDGKKVPKVFISALAAYLYLCTDDPEWKSKLENCLDIKRVSYYLSARSGFVEPNEKRKLKAAKTVISAKFAKGHPFFRKLLLSTDGKKLVADNFWEKDNSFWGIAASGEGSNWWGKLLTKQRLKMLEK